MGKTYKDKDKSWYEKGAKKKNKIRHPKKYFSNFDNPVTPKDLTNLKGIIKKNEEND
jgi:hypothetical protein